jgi:hypothetical protein
LYIEPHIAPYTYGSEAQLVIEATRFWNRFERHRLEASLTRVVYDALQEHPAYSTAFIRTDEPNAHVTPLISVVPVYQGKTDQLPRRVGDGIVSRAELISLPEPVPIYGLTHKSAGVLPQTLIEKFVGAQDGQVVH